MVASARTQAPGTQTFSARIFSACLLHQWQHPNAWQCMLRPLSWLYGSIVWLRRSVYRLGLFATERLPVPVIVVGNLNVGGSGKTPLAIWIVQQLQASGWQAGIVTRGYAGNATSPQSVTSDSDPARVGDEAVLLATRTGVPVWCGRQRAAAARALLYAHPSTQVIVSDDGLQHLSMSRDYSIVVIDSTRGFGNGQLLPAGPLREPVSRLNDVDAVVINHTGSLHPSLTTIQNSHAMRLIAQPVRNLRYPEHSIDITELGARTLHAIAGIGYPQRFFEQLQQAGMQFTSHAFPDHHAYRAEELNFSGDIIMTEKDAVKCLSFATEHMWVWPVAVQVDATLFNDITRLLTSGAHHG